MRTAKVALIAALGGVLFAYNTVIISGTTSSLSSRFSLTPIQLGGTVSAALWGTLLGAVGLGLIRNLNVRFALRTLALLFMVSAASCALAWNWPSLLLFRLIVGIAVGGSSVIIPGFLAEISPPALRGRLVGLFQFNIGMGVLLAYVTIYMVGRVASLRSIEWRIEFGFAALPAFIFLVLLLQIEGKNSALQSASENSRVAALIDQSLFIAEGGRFFSRNNLRPILLAAGLAIFNQVTGINAVLYYLNDILASVHGGRTNPNLLAVLIGAFNVYLSFIGIALVDFVGRRTLLLAGAFAMVACLARIGWTMKCGGGVGQLFWALIAFNAAFGLSQGPVIWVYLSEIFPDGLRVRGLSWGNSVLWTANGTVAFLFALTRDDHRALPFFLFAVATAVQFVVVLLFYPETKGLRLGALQSDSG